MEILLTLWAGRGSIGLWLRRAVLGWEGIVQRR